MLPAITHDPLKLAQVLWPDMVLYDKQEEILRSIWGNDQTYVYAGNMLGKDFIAGRGIVLFFLTRTPCRIVTTSTKDKHLQVLWSELHRAIRESQVPLSHTRGGNWVINQREITRVGDDLSYVISMVCNETTIESFQGHHVADVGDGIPRTMIVGDEASSLRHDIKKMVQSWAQREWWFGNPWLCSNFYYHALMGKPGTDDKGGNISRPNGIRGYYRYCIRACSEDSPNVRWARLQLRGGFDPTGEVIIPGVMPWDKYQNARKFWDPVEQRVCLDAKFPKDSRTRMFPPKWIDDAEERARHNYARYAESGGLDSAHGGDNTAMAAVNRTALIAIRSEKTPDTSVIPGNAIGFMYEHHLQPERMFLDAGGGGYEQGCMLRSMGYPVQLVDFGSAPIPAPAPGVTTLDERIGLKEQRSAYKNKRAEMYMMLRHYLDPATGKNFALPSELINQRYGNRATLREQMEAIPLNYTEEGQVKLPPKNKRHKDDQQECLTDIIGCSPDELDALALAVYGLDVEERWAMVGVN